MVSFGFRQQESGRTAAASLRRCSASLCAAGTGAALAGLVLTAPLAHADGLGDPASSVPTDPTSLTATAETYLYYSYSFSNPLDTNPDLIPYYLPDAGQLDAYGALSDLGQNGVTEFANLYGEEFQFFSEAISDITNVAQAIEGGISAVGSLLSGIKAVSAAAAAAPGFQPTVPELITGIQGYDTELTNQINSIMGLPTDSTTQETLVTGVLSDFQNAINLSVNNLPETYTSSGEIADLEGVLSSEANMTTELTALASDVPKDNVAGIIQDNAYLYNYADYTYNYMQDAIGAIDTQAYLAGL